jgi:Flp pilus assembly pilin Flp
VGISGEKGPDVKNDVEHDHKTSRLTGERGAGIAVYALLVALIAVVAIAGIQLFGGGVSDFFGGLPARLGF